MSEDSSCRDEATCDFVPDLDFESYRSAEATLTVVACAISLDELTGISATGGGGAGRGTVHSQDRCRRAPWHLVERSDARYRNVAVARILLQALEQCLRRPAPVPTRAQVLKTVCKRLTQAIEEDHSGR